MPHAANSLGRLEPVRPVCAAMPGRVSSPSACGSTKTRTRPPRSTNWSIAYCVLSDRSLGWTSTSTPISAGISAASRSIGLTSKNCVICRIDRPRLRRLARPAELALQRQAGEQSHRRLLRDGEVVDELGQVVFEKALALGLHERDRLFLVGRIAAGEAEIDELAALVDRHALQAEGDRAVFLVGEGLRIDELDAQLAARGVGVFAQHLAHARGVDAVLRDLLAEPVREIEPQGDRLLDLPQDRARPFGEREQLVGSQVEARRAAGSHCR